jgi:hypothetical protein
LSLGDDCAIIQRVRRRGASSLLVALSLLAPGAVELARQAASGDACCADPGEDAPGPDAGACDGDCCGTLLRACVRAHAAPVELAARVDDEGAGLRRAPRLGRVRGERRDGFADEIWHPPSA